MIKNNIRQHCSEVEKLMKGRMPFITRYGISIVVLVLVVIVVILLFFGDTTHNLIIEMIHHTFEQIKERGI